VSTWKVAPRSTAVVDRPEIVGLAAGDPSALNRYAGE